MVSIQTKGEMMEFLQSIGGLFVFLLIAICFLYLISRIGRGSVALKLREFFQWAFLKIGLVKNDGDNP